MRGFFMRKIVYRPDPLLLGKWTGEEKIRVKNPGEPAVTTKQSLSQLPPVTGPDRDVDPRTPEPPAA